MNIIIKNVKVVTSRSQETHCFDATIYVDNKVLCLVGNDGWGGCDNYLVANNSPTDWRARLTAINAELGKEIVSEEYQIANSMEHVVCDLVNKYLAEKSVKSLLRRRIAYTKPGGGVYQLPAKFKPSERTFQQIKEAKWWTGGHVLLAEMHFDDAVEIYKQSGH